MITAEIASEIKAAMGMALVKKANAEAAILAAQNTVGQEFGKKETLDILTGQLQDVVSAVLLSTEDNGSVVIGADHPQIAPIVAAINAV